MSAVITAAFYRAVLIGLLTGAVTTLTARQQEINNQQLSWENALISGVITCATIILARGGLEGGYDANRAATGNLNQSDVPMAAPNVTVEKVG